MKPPCYFGDKEFIGLKTSVKYKWRKCHEEHTKIYQVTNRQAMETTWEHFNYINKAITMSHLQQQAKCSISDFKNMTEATALLEQINDKIIIYRLQQHILRL